MKSDSTQQNNIDKLLKTSNYSEIHDFLKRTKYLKSSKNSIPFWKSNLPVIWFNNIRKESFFEELLFSYLKKGSHVNRAFLKCFFDSNIKSTFIKIIKLSHAFNNLAHWESFSIFNRDKQLNTLYKELEFVKNTHLFWKSKTIEHTLYIESISYEEILFNMVLFYENLKKNSDKLKENRSAKVSHEAILINILNMFLNIKKEDLNKKGIKAANSYNVEYFQTISSETHISLQSKFNEAVSFFFIKYDNEYQINKYITSLADFKLIEGLEAILITNEKHSLYRKTLERGNYDETYFTNKIVTNKELSNKIKKKDDFWNRQFELDTLSSIEYLKFLNISTEVNLENDTKIDIKKVLLILKTFSSFFMFQETINFNTQSYSQQIPKAFKNLFYTDSIIFYEGNDFLNKCINYFNWSREETKAILDFITLDVNNSDVVFDVKKNPLVKVGNQYIWLSNFMRDRRWEITLHKKLASGNLLNHNKQSKNQEEFISKTFQEAGFKAKSSFKYKHKSYKGEIDVITYKNNTLFICELKSTYIEEDMLKTSNYEIQNFNGKASDQLDLAKKYIMDNFDIIKRNKEFGINCNLEDIKIETIIISNIYQSDHLLINNRHLKVSLFELLIILKNDLYNMLVTKVHEILFNHKFEFPIDKMLKIYDRNNPDNKINDDSISEEDCNLWENEKDCAPNDIISAILKNKVWKHQDANKNFGIEEIELPIENN